MIVPLGFSSSRVRQDFESFHYCRCADHPWRRGKQLLGIGFDRHRQFQERDMHFVRGHISPTDRNRRIRICRVVWGVVEVGDGLQCCSRRRRGLRVARIDDAGTTRETRIGPAAHAPPRKIDGGASGLS